jgi:hypothetical protein
MRLSGKSVEPRRWLTYSGQDLVCAVEGDACAWQSAIRALAWSSGELPASRGRPVKFNHIGIPTAGSFDGEIPLPHLKMTVSDHLNNPFGIQWQRYWEGAPYPDLVKTVPHVAFEVDDLAAALQRHHIIIEPNSPSRGVMVAFIEVNGAPVELMQIDHQVRPDL